MPIYEYRCTRCGATVEILQKFSDRPLRKCRDCSGKLEKLVSVSSFHLKGSGWYKTDYAKAGSAPAGPEQGKAKETSEGSKPSPSDKGGEASGKGSATASSSSNSKD